MSKSQQRSNREGKKQPLLTPKEKKTAKRVKKLNFFLIDQRFVAISFIKTMPVSGLPRELLTGQQ